MLSKSKLCFWTVSAIKFPPYVFLTCNCLRIKNYSIIRDINFSMSRTKEEILAKPVRSDHVDTYGPWAWIAGFAFAVLITWMMFYIADGFS